MQSWNKIRKIVFWVQRLQFGSIGRFGSSKSYQNALRILFLGFEIVVIFAIPVFLIYALPLPTLLQRAIHITALPFLVFGGILGFMGIPYAWCVMLCGGKVPYLSENIDALCSKLWE